MQQMSHASFVIINKLMSIPVFGRLHFFGTRNIFPTRLDVRTKVRRSGDHFSYVELSNP